MREDIVYAALQYCSGAPRTLGALSTWITDNGYCKSTLPSTVRGRVSRLSQYLAHYGLVKRVPVKVQCRRKTQRKCNLTCTITKRGKKWLRANSHIGNET